MSSINQLRLIDRLRREQGEDVYLATCERVNVTTNPAHLTDGRHGTASRLIDALLDQQPAREQRETTVTEPGVYEVDGTVYVVKPNRQKTRLYAKRLVEIDAERATAAGERVLFEFEYASGAIYNIRPEHKMPFERARELTIRYGRCIVCNRPLKAAQSVEQGIGPVCIKSFAPAARATVSEPVPEPVAVAAVAADEPETFAIDLSNTTTVDRERFDAKMEHNAERPSVEHVTRAPSGGFSLTDLARQIEGKPPVSEPVMPPAHFDPPAQPEPEHVDEPDETAIVNATSTDLPSWAWPTNGVDQYDEPIGPKPRPFFDPLQYSDPIGPLPAAIASPIDVEIPAVRDMIRKALGAAYAANVLDPTDLTRVSNLFERLVDGFER